MRWIIGLMLLSSHAFAGYYFPNYWTKKEISVCFAPSGKKVVLGNVEISPGKISHKEKENVKQWLSEEYSFEKTIASFHGFHDCTLEHQADVVVYRNKDFGYIKSLLFDPAAFSVAGPYKDAVPTYPEAKSFVVFGKTAFKKSFVIHEFGHVLSLKHEHDRYDARQEEDNCLFTEGGGYQNPFDQNKHYGPYDRESIMNYCRIFEEDKDGFNRGLSEGDKNLIRDIFDQPWVTE